MAELVKHLSCKYKGPRLAPRTRVEMLAWRHMPGR